MGEAPVRFKPPNNELRKGSQVVGYTDRVYPLEGDTVTFGEVLVKGDLSGNLDYNDRTLRVIRVDTMIGLEIGSQGARGPVWKGVECEVVK